MRIYVASSWRNPYQQMVVLALRNLGFDVYDFKNPPSREGFKWESIDPYWRSWDTSEYIRALDHPIADAGFNSDFSAMQECDACVLVLPAGRSAHSEAGFMKGAGKKVYVLQLTPEEPELMYKMFNGICDNFDELCDILLTGLGNVD